LAFTISDFAKTRPFLFHLTDRDNVGEIRRSRHLQCASRLMQQAGDGQYRRRKRMHHITVQIGATTVKIRDQQPLHGGNITFEGKWSFEDVIESLNSRVFFWPGRDEGPISYGERHFERYAGEQPAILRVSTAEIVAANAGIDPLFCRFNSGSPRCAKGIGSPRGPNTFVPCHQADFTPSKVVEVTFTEVAILPAKIEVADSVSGPWRRL